MTYPRVSVVMPVFSREEYIVSAIDSVLMQSFKDFELIIVDDGSTDSTVEIIKQYDDPRIRLIQHEENKGVAAARNTGYRNAIGELIAISDSDDVNHVERLLKQVSVLDANSDIDVVSCCYQEFYGGENGNIVLSSQENEEIRANWMFTPGIPSFMMFRKEKIERRNLLYHDETYKAAVDYQWYTSLDDDIQITCIPEVLYYYRRHDSQISQDGYTIQQQFADHIRLKQLIKIGLQPTNEEFEIHRILNYMHVKEMNDQLFMRFIKWCEKIKDANDKVLYIQREYLDTVLAKKLIILLNSESLYNHERYMMLLKSEFRHYFKREESYFDIQKVKQVAKEIRDKQVFIFGTKQMGYELKVLFEQENIKVSSFIDNDKSNHSKEINQCKVISPEQVGDIQNKVFLISIISDARLSVKEQLIKEFGVQEEFIFTLQDIGHRRPIE